MNATSFARANGAKPPPRVSYGADRSGLVKLIGAEMSASPWTEGESATGPRIEVHGRTLACPPTDEDLDWLRRRAKPESEVAGTRRIAPEVL